MPHSFDESTRAGVLAHMNADHRDDNVLISRAFGVPSAQAATMTGFDGDGGEWAVVDAGGSESTLRVPWPGGAITQRPEVRREIVALYDEACHRLGVAPRPHD